MQILYYFLMSSESTSSPLVFKRPLDSVELMAFKRVQSLLASLDLEEVGPAELRAVLDSTPALVLSVIKEGFVIDGGHDFKDVPTWGQSQLIEQAELDEDDQSEKHQTLSAYLYQRDGLRSPKLLGLQRFQRAQAEDLAALARLLEQVKGTRDLFKGIIPGAQKQLLQKLLTLVKDESDRESLNPIRRTEFEAMARKSHLEGARRVHEFYEKIVKVEIEELRHLPEGLADTLLAVRDLLLKDGKDKRVNWDSGSVKLSDDEAIRVGGWDEVLGEEAFLYKEALNGTAAYRLCIYFAKQYFADRQKERLQLVINSVDNEARCAADAGLSQKL